jgi:hypothetical protein
VSKRPSAVRTEIVRPDDPSGPAKRTAPAVAARTGAPGRARTSIPRCWPAANGSAPWSNRVSTSPLAGHAHEAAVSAIDATLRHMPPNVRADEPREGPQRYSVSAA